MKPCESYAGYTNEALRNIMQVTQTKSCGYQVACGSSTAVRGLPFWLDMLLKQLFARKYTTIPVLMQLCRRDKYVWQFFPAVPDGKQGFGNLHVSEARDPLSSQNVAKRTKHLFRQMETFMSRLFGSAVCFTLGLPRLLLFAHGRCDLSNLRHIADELYRTGYSG